jgi:aspartate ammonia-lyase
MTDSIIFTGRTLNDYPDFIVSLAEIKKASALANSSLKAITGEDAARIAAACDALTGAPSDPLLKEEAYFADGLRIVRLINRVISQKSGLSEEIVGRNQIADDVISTAENLTVLKTMDQHGSGVETLCEALTELARRYRGSVHLGRSHMQEALPVSWGATFGAMALRVKKAYMSLLETREAFLEVRLGLTPLDLFELSQDGFAEAALLELRKITGQPLVLPAEDPVLPGAAFVEALEGNDRFVRLLSALRLLAMHIARLGNDLYLYSSGPRCGLAELSLPAIAPGSTIMPGKINPSMAELMLQILHETAAADQMAAFSWMEEDIDQHPANSDVFFDSLEIIEIIGRGAVKFVEKCVSGVSVKEDRNTEHLKHSASIVALARAVCGKENAVNAAKLARRENISLPEALVRLKLASASEAEVLTDSAHFAAPEALRSYLESAAKRGEK